MKLIVLILATDTGVWVQCQEQWRRYMHLHSDIRCFFMKCDPALDREVALTGDTIYLKGHDSYEPGCWLKTMSSIQFMLQHAEFDFIFRTNMSSVLHLNNLFDLVSTVKADYAGSPLQYGDVTYASGAGILLSKKSCNLLMSTQTGVNHMLPDDVVIGAQLKELPLVPLQMFPAYQQQKEEITIGTLAGVYHIRCKPLDQNAENWIAMMSHVIDLLR